MSDIPWLAEEVSAAKLNDQCGFPASISVKRLLALIAITRAAEGSLHDGNGNAHVHVAVDNAKEVP